MQAPPLPDLLSDHGLARRGPVGCGDDLHDGSGAPYDIHSPIDGSLLRRIHPATKDDVGDLVEALTASFLIWREVPAPRRGEFVRRIGVAVRQQKTALGALITAEVGKTVSEAEGEVQEWIDICDFACGLSRQLQGATLPSERRGHRLQELYLPLGPVGVISAFNFPVAVWAWNAMIALVCGDTVLWKPSEKAPLCAIACHALASAVARDMALPAVLGLAVGDGSVGRAVAAHPGLPLVSATGSVPMGRAVAIAVAQRLGRSLLELGGNNGLILTPSADLELAMRAIVFAAVGTCGQRCTSLRRLIVHESIAALVRDRLLAIYGRLTIGDPRQEGILVGPLIDAAAGMAMEEALAEARRQGGIVHGGGLVGEAAPAGGCYVRPALVEIRSDAPILKVETFAPILYLVRYQDFDQALRIHNDVPQGLSSAIFTARIDEAERFLSAPGSDCGMANVNVGTSGAEIGGAFGGEKSTGGGRESGSDAWKSYMRRLTSAINHSAEMPLAQGVDFDPH